MRAMRDRDNQKSRVYAAERKIQIGAVSETGKQHLGQDVAAAQKYVDHVTSTIWFQRRWGKRKIVVGAGRGGGRAYGGFITLGVWARKHEAVLLHEIAHCIAPSHVMHGPEYCGVMLFLVEKMMGKQHSDSLRSSYKEHRARYSLKAVPEPSRSAIGVTKQRQMATAALKQPLSSQEREQLATLLRRAAKSGMLGDSSSKTRSYANSIARLCAARSEESHV